MTIADRAPALAEKIARTFVDQVAIYRHGATTDSEGNATGTATLVDTVDGRWQSPSADELEIAAQAGQRLDATVTVALGTDIRPGDTITVRGTWKVGTVTSDRVQTKATLEATDG